MLDSTAWQEQEEDLELPMTGKKVCVAHASASEEEKTEDKEFYPFFLQQ